LLKKFTVGVCSAMHPKMAGPTQDDHIGDIKAKIVIARPGLDMVSAQALESSMARATTHTGVIVSFVDGSNSLLPFNRGIDVLTFWATAIDIVGVCFARLAKHGISFACLAPMFEFANRCHSTARNLENLHVMINVCFRDTELLCNVTSGSLKVNVFARQPFFVLVWLARGFCFPSSLADRYFIASKPPINLFRIAINQLSYSGTTQLFNKIFLSKPCLVNRLLSALPFAFAFQRTKAASLITTTNNFSITPLTI